MSIYTKLELSLTYKQQFKGFVAEVFKEQNIDYKVIHDDHVLAQNGTIYGLENILNQIAKEDKEGSKRSIANHFSSVKQLEKLALNIHNESFENSKHLLSVRLRDITFKNHPDFDKMVTRTDIGSVISTVVYKFDIGTEAVIKDTVKRWGISEKKIWEIALENTFKRTILSRDKIPFKETDVIYLYNEKEQNAASLIYNIENIKDCNGIHGSIIVIPSEISIVCFPVNDINTIKAMIHMAGLSLNFFSKEKLPVSPHVYWYFDKNFDEQKVELRDGRVSLFATDKFMDMLNSLK